MNPSRLTFSNPMFNSRLRLYFIQMIHYLVPPVTLVSSKTLGQISPSPVFSPNKHQISLFLEHHYLRNSVFPKLYFSTPEPLSHSSPLYFIYKIFQYTAVLLGLLKTCQRNAGNGKNIPQRPSILPHIHQSCPA